MLVDGLKPCLEPLLFFTTEVHIHAISNTFVGQSGAFLEGKFNLGLEQLIKIFRIIPVHTADVERTFSQL